ncbi:MAG: hypothetical protein ACJ8AT_14730 [Hyalangium sp.]|uniref:hypothetical protein n=1 Tax=Hyalangium sp. TaxID=2028555 RepID=UPI00389A16FF
MVRHSMWLGLAVLTGALSTQARAQPAADLTGVYKTKGGELAVLQAENESLLYYSGVFPQGNSVGTCECLLALQQKKSPTEWTLRGSDSSDAWALRLDPKKLTLQSSQPGCCGAGFPGSGAFTRGNVKPPQSCKVKASRAYFYAPDEQNTQRKMFVVAGDSVEAYVPAVEPDLVPARFKGSKKATVGLLKLAELDCQQQASNAPSAPATGAGSIASLAGKWTGVEREGQGYVIREYCESHTPRFNLKPGGDVDMDYGREKEHLKVTDLKSGAAGAYTLELKHDSGSKEPVEWTVADAKQGIVQLKGSSTFPKGALFVRDDKKAGIPKERKGCDESEEE